MRKKYGLSLLFALSLCGHLYAGDPTLDRLIDNMSTSDTKLQVKSKQQLYYLTRNGHDKLLHPYLKSDNDKHRIAAMKVAASLKSNDTLLALIGDSLKSKNPIVKREAAKCLGHFKNITAANKLKEAISGEVVTRITVLNALAKTGQNVGGQEIADQLGHSDYRVRYAAAHAMFYCKIIDQKEAVKKIIEKEKTKEVGTDLLFKDYKYRILAALYATLLLAGDDAGSALADSLTSQNIWVRNITVKAYGLAKNNSLVDKSFSVLKENENSRIRLSAAQGLTAVGQPKDIPSILGLLKEEKSSKVREELGVALRKISGRSYGYHGIDSQKKRDEAEAKWRKWWVENAYRYGLRASNE